MEQSILKSTKKLVGLDPDYDVFDLDIITHINSAFSTLNQLGLGPTTGFMIEDDVALWDDFLGGDSRLNSVKSYVFIKVRLAFDPPATSYAIAALEKQLEELTWRLNVARESTAWTPPFVALVVEE